MSDKIIGAIKYWPKDVNIYIWKRGLRNGMFVIHLRGEVFQVFCSAHA